MFGSPLGSTSGSAKASRRHLTGRNLPLLNLVSPGSLLGSTSGSLDSESPSPPGSPAASSSGSGSYDGTLAGPMCAAVPLTEDHKPDK